MSDFEEHYNYSSVNEHTNENDEDEDGIVEYLEIDSEVMETLQDPNEYFTQVNQSHQGQIYIEQNSSDSQQLSLVIQNDCESLKQSSSQQQNDQNGVTNVLWTNNMINGQMNDNKTAVKIENQYTTMNYRNNCKTEKKRIMKTSNSPNINEKDVMLITKEHQTHSESDSLDLFFQSMAQTVSHLPSQIQAKIKMDICNVISTAEIKYCTQQANLHDNFNENIDSRD